MIRSWFQTRLPMVAMCSLILAVGCGDGGKGTVKGKVTYQNAPVTGYVLNLVWKEKGFAVSILVNDEGEYTQNEPLEAGTYSAYLTPKPPEPPPPPGTKVKKAPVSKIPVKYTDAAKSDLKVTVKGGSNEIPLELKD